MSKIKFDDINKYAKKTDSFPASRALRRAISQNGIAKASQDNKSVVNSNPIFSIEVNTGKVTDQKQSGRCWIYAGLNTLRFQVSKNYNLPDGFELSQGYIFFWDKLERGNWFYNNVIKTAKKELDSRKVAFLFHEPQGDGGQWDLICSIIEKYGAVPKSAFPETYDTEHSGNFNSVYNHKLRKDGLILRELVSKKASKEALDKQISKFNNQNYRILSLSFGDPKTVDHFNFEYKDKQKNYHIENKLTPKTFYKKFVRLNLEDYVSIINAPTKDKPFHKTYTVEFLGNIVGGRSVKHLNVKLAEYKDLIIKQLKQGEPVWFGVEIGPQTDSNKGIMDLSTFASDDAYGINSSMNKGQQLSSWDSAMNHAMVITGVDLNTDNKPIRWKVENSWGEKPGHKGYFVMSDDWLDLYAYQAVINKKYLSKDLRKVQEKSTPIVLKPWDPIGTLA